MADCIYNRDSISKNHESRFRAGRKGACPGWNSASPGIPCGDLFCSPPLLDGALDALRQIVRVSTGLKLLDGGRPVGFARVASSIIVLLILLKGGCLALSQNPICRITANFSEQRHFVPAPPQNEIHPWEGGSVPFVPNCCSAAKSCRTFCFAAEICEDLWVAARHR